MAVTEKDVRNALKSVKDPELGLDLVVLGLIYDIEIDGESYDYDVVIDKGAVSKRKKKRSKAYRDRYGHTPLSADEPIPWGGQPFSAELSLPPLGGLWLVPED